MAEYLCDRCGHTGDDCPFPQEDHCEHFTMKEPAFRKGFDNNAFTLVYGQVPGKADPYIECWIEGDSFDVTSIVKDVMTKPGELVLDHDNMHFKEFLEPFINTMCVSAREVTFGRFNAKTLVFKLRDDWKDYCFSEKEFYGETEEA